VYDGPRFMSIHHHTVRLRYYVSLGLWHRRMFTSYL